MRAFIEKKLSELDTIYEELSEIEEQGLSDDQDATLTLAMNNVDLAIDRLETLLNQIEE